MSPVPLPAGWLVRVSRSKGKTFYINTFTKATQWSRPTEPAEPDQAAVEEEARVAKRQRVEEEAKDAGSVEAAITRCMRVGAMLSPWPHQVNAVQKLLAAITSDKRTVSVTGWQSILYCSGLMTDAFDAAIVGRRGEVPAAA